MNDEITLISLGFSFGFKELVQIDFLIVQMQPTRQQTNGQRFAQTGGTRKEGMPLPSMSFNEFDFLIPN